MQRQKVKVVKTKENLITGVYPDTKITGSRCYPSNDTSWLPSGWRWIIHSNLVHKLLREIQAAAIYGKVLQHNLNEQELAESSKQKNPLPPTLTWKQIVGLALLSNQLVLQVMTAHLKTAFSHFSKTMDREQFCVASKLASLAKN